MSGHAAVAGADDAALTAVSTLLGASVADNTGATLGTVADVMIEAAAGRIVYVAVSVGGIVGIGERLFAVPWECFVLDPVGGKLAVRFARATLDRHDGFDPDAWPVCGDPKLIG